MARAAKKRESSSSVAALRGGKGRSSSSSSSASAPSKSGTSPSRAGGWWEGVKSILGAVLIFLVIRTFFVEAFRIPSSSMVPTLLVGDWLFVNKLRYGPHLPFTSINLPGYAEPKRGEVVIFESPPQNNVTRPSPTDSTPTLVKRIVAVGGDTVYMRDAVLHVNGIAQRQGFGAVPPEAGSEDEGDKVDPVSFAWLRDSTRHGTRFEDARMREQPFPSLHNWGPIVMPPRRFFMLGDNRENSVDSRYYGMVPRENVRGRPMFVYYSYDTEGGLDFFRAITEIRWGRIGHWIR